jgi:hypothetical protein
MTPLYVLLGGIIVLMTIFAVPAIIADFRARHGK